jgi:hypothetical protein
MRITSAGDVGIGTVSPQAKLEVARVSSASAAFDGGTDFLRLFATGGSSFAEPAIKFQEAGTDVGAVIAGKNTANGAMAIVFANRATSSSSSALTEKMRIDQDGNVGIGTSSPSSKLTVVSTGAAQSIVSGTDAGNGFIQFVGAAGVRLGYMGYGDSSSQMYMFNDKNAALIFGNNSTERARITSSGDLLVGRSSANGRLTVYNPITAAGSAIATFYSDFGSTENIRVVNRVDGGIANYSANNVNISDERLKTNIVAAGNYLTKICAIPVKLFNYKDEPEGTQQSLGVIAQEVERVAPELVDCSGFGDTPKDGVPTKTIYQTDLQYALMKCIQEQQALIQDLTTRLTTLEGN